MKALVRVIGLFGSAIWIVVLVFASKIGDWSDGSGYHNSSSDYFWGVCPLIYFVICFCTSFAKHKSILILGFGIVGHVILGCFLIPIFAKGQTTGIFLVPSLISVLAWIGMYYYLEDAPAA